MQRLNIPLHRYQQTTRLSRRVVSLFAVAATIGFLILMVAATIWYGRDTTSSSAPQDTAVVLHFLPNLLTWDATERVLDKIPLVSNRPLTTDDIQPFARGEFSLFVATDGTRSVAVRAAKADLPTSELDALGIIVQETAPGVILLSDRPMARSGWNPSHIWFGSVHFPWNPRIGSMYVPGETDLSGAIYATKGQTTIRLPKQHLSVLPWKTVPESTIAVMSTPALPNTNVDGVTNAIDTILSSYQTPSAAFLASHLLSNKGTVILVKNKDFVDYLLTTSSVQFKKESQEKLVQMAAALQIPRIQPLVLPDNSVADEIIVDPSLTTIEETTVAGTIVSRASSREGGYVFSSELDEIVTITNSQALLDFSLGEKKTGVRPLCSSNAAFVDVRSLLDLSKDSMHARSAALLSVLANTYGVIGLDEGYFHTTIHLCY